MGGALAQTRSERVLEKPNEPPLPEGNTSGSREGSMGHTFELMDTVPPTPHDSPLTGGYIPGSDEGRIKLKELKAICTKLSKHVLDLEKEKDAQAVESSDDDLDEEDASKLGRKSDKTKSMFQDSDFDVLDDDMEDVEGEKVHTATTGVSTPITTARKAKEKGVAIKDVEDSPRPIRSITTLQTLLTIDPKDKGKGVLVEEEPEKPEKVKRRDQGLPQIKSYADLAQRLHEEELAELDRAQKERQKIDADHELAVRLTREEQEKYTIEERELGDSMDVVPRDDVAIDVESLATKYPIVDWKTHILNENMMYYQINRADGSSKNYKIFSDMLNDFDRQDVIDLHRDLKTLFEPNEEDEIWKNQQDYNLISWRLFDSCGVHVLLMNTGVAIHMMIEKKYPLTQETLSRMLNRRLEMSFSKEAQLMSV
ncbi:hypothetical protein Tco_0966452 [Tanacetum coccineum]